MGLDDYLIRNRIITFRSLIIQWINNIYLCIGKLEERVLSLLIK